MMKYTVASVTTVLNKEENRKITTLEHANQIMTPNREMSDTTHRERLVVVTTDLLAHRMWHRLHV